MNPILQGSLRYFPPDQLLTLLASYRHSGVLQVDADAQHARVFFADGSIVHAEADAADEPREVVCNLFVAGDGAFAFSSPARPADDMPQVHIDLKAAIEEGLRRGAEWRSLLEIFPDDAMRMHVTDPGTDAQIQLSFDELRILMKIGSGRTLQGLLADLARPALGVYRVLHRLETAGLLVRSPAVAPALSTSETLRSFEVGSSGDTDTLVNADVATNPQGVQDSASMQVTVSVSEPSPDSNATTAPKPLDLGVTEVRVIAEEPLVGSLTTPDGAVYPLLDAICSIGRDPGNLVPINDGSVSTFHARILRRSDGFVIEDAESRNGTAVNGERITEARLLVDSDVIRLGKVTMVFNVAARVTPLTPALCLPPR